MLNCSFNVHNSDVLINYEDKLYDLRDSRHIIRSFSGLDLDLDLDLDLRVQINSKTT